MNASLLLCSAVGGTDSGQMTELLHVQQQAWAAICAIDAESDDLDSGGGGDDDPEEPPVAATGQRWYNLFVGSNKVRQAAVFVRVCCLRSLCCYDASACVSLSGA